MSIILLPVVVNVLSFLFVVVVVVVVMVEVLV